MDNIIIMKYGVHAGEKVDDIMSRKIKEIKNNGFCFFGYGGSFIHPTNQVQPFCKDKDVYLLLTRTKSNYTKNTSKSLYYSVDKNEYLEIPNSINVYGSKYALVLDELIKYDKDINLCEYEVGIGNSKGKTLSEYFRYRVDKACAVYKGKSSNKKIIHIDYIAKLKYPYSVFVK